MIFKRKQARPAGLGKICSIKPEIVANMRQTENYITHSVTHRAELMDSYITKSSLNKNKVQNKVMMADAKLVYVSADSVFNGLVNVIPLAIEHDSAAGHGIRKISNGNRSFLIKLDSLSLTSQENINAVMGKYYPSVRDSLANNIITHVNNNFSWENR